MSMDESVLCIPTERFHSVGYFQGFASASDVNREALLDPAYFEFRQRNEVEEDANYKQLIPYVVLTWQDHIYVYQRGHEGTEKRLQAKRSVGIGGHINSLDHDNPSETYRIGMYRELHEEVAIDSDFQERFLGWINDDRTFVGSVHLGVVHQLELIEPKVTPLESAISEAGFVQLRQLQNELANFETWSQFVLVEFAKHRHES